MKYSIIKILPLFLGGFFWSQNFKQDSLQFKKISDEILVNGKSYEDLREFDIEYSKDGKFTKKIIITNLWMRI